MLGPALVVLVLLGNELPRTKPTTKDEKICVDGKTAKDIYLQAYVLKQDKPAEALALFRKVLGCTASDDAYHEKAKLQIAKLTEDAGTK